MPNWCEGTLKIRGTAKQMLDFVKTAFEKGDCFFLVKTTVILTSLSL